MLYVITMLVDYLHYCFYIYVFSVAIYRFDYITIHQLVCIMSTIFTK